MTTVQHRAEKREQKFSLKRLVAMPIAAILVAVGLTVVPAAPSEAAVIQWGTNSGTSPNYQANVNVDFVMTGNGVLQCVGNPVISGSGTCAELHSTSTNTTNANDNFSMQNVRAVTDLLGHRSFTMTEKHYVDAASSRMAGGTLATIIANLRDEADQADRPALVSN